MTLGQSKLIDDYYSLRTKVSTKNIGLLLQFCTYFQTDDLTLYEDFENAVAKSKSGNINIDDLIRLYAKRYNLDPQRNVKQIMHLFINNAIANGISYHLNSSANFDSIMKSGLGGSAIGLKTEERKDYERIQSLDIFKHLQPFIEEKNESKIYYSNKPILNTHYEDRPEWLKQLKLNSHVVADDPKTSALVNEILHKYDKKYDFAEKMLFLLPNPAGTIPSHVIDEFQQRNSPEQVISYFNNYLSQNDLHTEDHIPGTDIIAVNLKTYNMYVKNNNGTVEEIKPYNDETKN